MIDFLLENNDLVFENGDLAIGDCDEQNQSLLLMSDKGDFKEFPDRCVGVTMWLKDDDKLGLLAEVKQEFERDRLRVKKIGLSEDEKLIIDAKY